MQLTAGEPALLAGRSRVMPAGRLPAGDAEWSAGRGSRPDRRRAGEGDLDDARAFVDPVLGALRMSAAAGLGRLEGVSPAHLAIAIVLVCPRQLEELQHRSTSSFGPHLVSDHDLRSCT
jgi:hypothetical protein